METAAAAREREDLCLHVPSSGRIAIYSTPCSINHCKEEQLQTASMNLGIDDHLVPDPAHIRYPGFATEGLVGRDAPTDGTGNGTISDSWLRPVASADQLASFICATSFRMF